MHLEELLSEDNFLTNSKSSFLLEERAHTWTPALKMSMSPILKVAGTEGTLFLWAFSTHSIEKKQKNQLEKETGSCVCVVLAMLALDKH